MADIMQDPDTVSEIKFSFFYCMFSFWSSGLLVLVCTLSEGLEAFGSVLHSKQFLLLAAVYELGKVGLAKLLSGHGPSLSLARGSPPDGKTVRGPILRKIWVKLSRLVVKLTPVWHLIIGVGVLLGSWLFFVYVTVCFGAPLLSSWSETGSFCLLMTLLTAYPVLLILGPSLSSLFLVYSSHSHSPLASTLFLIWMFTVLGAWLGAFPIPLDWDRPWQVWPIPCCLGAVAGHVTGNVVAAGRVWPWLATASGSGKRKFV